MYQTNLCYIKCSENVKMKIAAKEKLKWSRVDRPVILLLDVLGKKWAMRIIWELRSERLKFRDLQKKCDDVSPTSLNARIKDLRTLGIVDHDIAGYGLSSAGRELGKQLLKLGAWSNKWISIE